MTDGLLKLHSNLHPLDGRDPVRRHEERWADERHSVDDLFYIVRTLMPYGRPATLSQQEYIDIIAYLLMMNGYPAGAQALPWIRACSAHNNMA